TRGERGRRTVNRPKPIPDLSHPTPKRKSPSRANAARASTYLSSRGRTRTYDPLINSRVLGALESNKASQKVAEFQGNVVSAAAPHRACRISTHNRTHTA